jgi:hypothetical protein
MSSGVFQHATPQNPCPICSKTDWCRFGDRAMLCMRVESTHAHEKGGWWHFYDRPNPEWLPKVRRQTVASTMPGHVAKSMLDTWRTESTDLLGMAARDLGVTLASLEALEAVWSVTKNALAFPMLDGAGNYIGIRLRNSQGFKWAVTGSRNGLFYPNYWEDDEKVAFLPEGPTNTAALLSLGLFAIGRPNVLVGNDLINDLLKRLGIYKAIIVADNDEMKQMGNKEGRPGILGAIKLKQDLQVKSVTWIPPSPCKDARDFVRMGGSRELIMSDIKNKIWCR